MRSAENVTTRIIHLLEIKHAENRFVSAISRTADSDTRGYPRGSSIFAAVSGSETHERRLCVALSVSELICQQYAPFPSGMKTREEQDTGSPHSDSILRNPYEYG